jgi:hypothetical protein
MRGIRGASDQSSGVTVADLEPAVGVTPDATQGCTLWGWCQRSNVPIPSGLMLTAELLICVVRAELGGRDLFGLDRQ